MGEWLDQQHNLRGMGEFVVLYGIVGIIRMGDVAVAENKRMLCRKMQMETGGNTLCRACGW